jgi:hypothetical protein
MPQTAARTLSPASILTRSWSLLRLRGHSGTLAQPGVLPSDGQVRFRRRTAAIAPAKAITTATGNCQTARLAGAQAPPHTPSGMWLTQAG